MNEQNANGQSAATDLSGRTFSGRYRIIDRVGKGGMSVVYRAIHLPTQRTVALKVLTDDVSGDEKQILRFEQEARASSRLRHPNIIRVFDYGRSEDGKLFIAMELLEGRTIGQLLRGQGPVSPARACRILGRVCDALAVAHEQGIIHRDLKPDNVFLPAGAADPDFVKLLDFGIAKVVGEQGYETLTQTGFICGTPMYISPEQSLGMQLDGRADLYSVGVLLFELLAGRTPFQADSPIALVMKHIHNQPPRLTHVNPSVEAPTALSELMQSLLAKDKHARPRSAREVSRLLSEIEATCRELPAARPLTALVAEEAPSGEHDAPTRLVPPPSAAHLAAARPTPPEMVETDAVPPPRERPVPTGQVSSSPSALPWVLAALILVLGIGAAAWFVPWRSLLGGEAAPADDIADSTPTPATEKTPAAAADAPIKAAQVKGDEVKGDEGKAGEVEVGAERPAAVVAASTVTARVRVDGARTPRRGLQTAAEVVAAPGAATAAWGQRAEAVSERGPRAALEPVSVAAAPAAEGAPTERVFLIETVPSGARVTVRGRAEGRTPYRFEATEETGPTTVIVSRRGYLPETWQYHPEAAPPPGQDKVKLKLRRRKPATRKPSIKWEE